MEQKRIYIADDEPHIRNIIVSFLEKEGYLVEGFSNGRDLLDAFTAKPSDMVVIDVMMPRLDGYSLCAAIRQCSDIPIIIVSAKDTEIDRIAGLTLGCDDYMTKPFSPMELVIRIKNMFRRMDSGSKKDAESTDTISVKGLTLNSASKHAYHQQIQIPLTGMEFNFLHYLLTNKGRAVSRTELLDKVWGFESAVETRATDDMVKRIRRKLSDADCPLKIETVWGFGFIVEEDPS